MSLAELHDRHATEVLEMVRAALVAELWIMTRAAARLGCTESALRVIVARDERLADDYASRRSLGRPRKSA